MRIICNGKNVIKTFLGEKEIRLNGESAPDGDITPDDTTKTNLFDPNNVYKGRYADYNSISTVKIVPSFTVGSTIKIVNPSGRTINIIQLTEPVESATGSHSTATNLYTSSDVEIIYTCTQDTIIGIEIKKKSGEEYSNFLNNVKAELYEIYIG